MHIKECTVKGEKKKHWVKGNLAENKQTNKKKKKKTLPTPIKRIIRGLLTKGDER